MLTVSWSKFVYSPYFGMFAVFFAGLLFPFSFAPYGYWFIGLFSLWLYYCFLKNASFKKSFVYSLLFGVAIFFSGSHWLYISVREYAYTSVFFASCVLLLFSVFVSVIYICSHALFYRLLRLNGLSIFGFIWSWVLFEYLRTVIFTGFPWFQFGYAFSETPLMALAAVVGVYGVSMWALLFFFSLMMVIKGLIKKPFFNLQSCAYLSLITALILVLYTANRMEWVKVNENESIQIAAVQTKVDQGKKWLPQFRDEIISNIVKQIKPFIGTPILILPESAFPDLYSNLSTLFKPLDKIAKDADMTVISGILYDEITEINGKEHELIYNSIITLGHDHGRYNKSHLVPFGEYVPFRKFIERFAGIYPILMSDIAAGKKVQQNLLVKGHRFMALNCYEVLFPQLVFKRRQNADFLLSLSNLAWWNNKMMLNQFLQMSRFRAAELGKMMITVNNTGITTIIDHKGQVVKSLPAFKRAVLQGEIKKTRGKTPYSYYGPSVLIIVVALSLLLLLSVLALKKRMLKQGR